MSVAHFLNTSPLVWPTCFIINQILPLLALTLTPPKSPIRRLTMVVTVLLAYQFSHTISSFAPDDARLREAAMIFTCAFLFNNNDLLNLSSMSYEQHVAWKRSVAATKSDALDLAGETKEETGSKTAEGSPTEGSLWERVKWSSAIYWNFRRIGTQYQITNISPFSARDPSYTPSRPKFLLRTLFMLLLSKCMIDLSDFVLLKFPSTLLYLLTRPYLHFFPRLLNVSILETVFRSLLVLNYWVNCGMRQFHCYQVFALIFVGLGIQDPEQWLPYFGFVSETWSVRQYWGFANHCPSWYSLADHHGRSVWHQTFRQFLTPNVDLFVFSILGFPRGHLVTRYTRLMLVFLLSGLLHLTMEYQIEFAKGEAGSVNFFVLQALGIMLEDGVQAIARIHFPKMGRQIKRRIGYTWVAVFLLETTPVWFYSQNLYWRVRKGAIVTYPDFANGKDE